MTIATLCIVAGVAGTPTGDAVVQPSSSARVRVVMRGLSDPDSRTIAEQELDRLEVNAGGIDALGTREPSSGRFVRWKVGGGFLVWTFQATVYHAGTTARFELVALPSEADQLRFAIGTSTKWTAPGAGNPFPESGRALVDVGLTNGESVVVQVAHAVRSNDRAGPRHLKIRYAAALNGPETSVAPPLVAPEASRTAKGRDDGMSPNRRPPIQRRSRRPLGEEPW